jgi:uncharacterized protein (TIGR03437 family)
VSAVARALCGAILACACDGAGEFSTSVPGGDITALVLDRNGDIWVTGVTNSPDLPVSPGAFQPRYGGGGICGLPFQRPCFDAFVAKLSGTDGKLLAATYLGGSADEYPAGIALDEAGKVYVAGTTFSDDFPVTSGALQRTHGSGFVTKLEPTLTRAIYSTYFGSSYLVGGSTGGIGAFAVDATGGVYVAGSAALDFPTTAGAFRGGDHGLIVARLNPEGLLVYSARLGDASPGAIAIDSAGSAYIAGATADENFPVTSGALQTRIAVPGYYDGFVTKLNAAGSGLVWSTFVGADLNSEVHDLAVDATGNVYVTGPFTGKISADGVRLLYTVPIGGNGLRLDPDGTVHVWGTADIRLLPTTPGAHRRCYHQPIGYDLLPHLDNFYARLDPAGAVAYATFIEAGLYDARQWLAVAADGDLVAVGVISLGGIQPSTAVLRISFVAPVRSLECVANAANLTPGVVAPGELVTLFGTGMGPLDGTRVLFDGVPAPLLFVGDGQINAVVPFAAVLRDSTEIVVESPGGRTNSITVPVKQAVPGIFRVGATDRAAAINQDGSLNGPDNPAPRGSVLTLYATGGGMMDSGNSDGAIAPLNPLYRLLAPLKINFFGLDSIVDYAGSAPGEITGFVQINVRVPENCPVGHVSLNVSVAGQSAYEDAWVWVR